MKRFLILECIQKTLNLNLNNLTNEELKKWLNMYIKLKKNKSNTNTLTSMITKFRCEKSANGFDMSTLKSALQKYIRRGNEDMALRSMEELDRFAEVEDGSGERLRTNMLHRLQIIFLEDIGLGNYHLWKKMCEWMDILFEERKKPNRNRVVEIQTLELIVRNLCKSKKIRACSFMNSLTQLMIDDKKIVDEYFGGYFFQIDNENENNLIKNLDETLSKKDWKSIIYLRKLFENKNGPKEIEKIMEKYKIDLTFSKKWKKDIIKLREGFLLYMLPLGYYLYGSEPLELFQQNELTRWPKNGIFVMNDFVYDKHTKCAIDRTTEYFVKETSKVSNEVFILPKELKMIYEWSRCGKLMITWHSKKTKDGTIFYYQRDSNGNFIENSQTWDNTKSIDQIQYEKDLDFIVRIQLTTSDQKQDTYYAEYKDVLYFVKGPFRDSSIIDDYIRFQQLKKENNIPYMEDIYSMMLYPNRWDISEIPLGYRKSIDLNKKHPFLVIKSLISKEMIKTRIHSSVRWPLTKIVDDRETNGMRIDVFKLKGQMMIDYLNAIVFRLEYNIGDFADRNFMIIKDRVLSVDEEVMSKKINLKNELKSEKKYIFLKEAYEEYKNQLYKNIEF